MSPGNHKYSIYREKQARHRKLDSNVVTELDEYKSPGMIKNYASTSRLIYLRLMKKLDKKWECF